MLKVLFKKRKSNDPVNFVQSPARLAAIARPGRQSYWQILLIGEQEPAQTIRYLSQDTNLSSILILYRVLKMATR